MHNATPGPLYRAIVEYDGTDLRGFQLQAEGRTVQGELEHVLSHLGQQAVRVVGAGRTDAGVHARGQVIAFRISWRHGLADLFRAFNALLPPDLAVRSLETAPPGFHPRFSASERWYRYQIGQWEGHSPLRARYAWELGPDLDLPAMNQAAAALLGSHDFASFGRAPAGENTTRVVTQAHWCLDPPYLYFDIRANAFLHRMVRRIVGTLAWIGQGRLATDKVASILAQRDRALVAPPAPPQGLILMAVTYPADSEISQRQLTRSLASENIQRQASRDRA